MGYGQELNADFLTLFANNTQSINVLLISRVGRFLIIHNQQYLPPLSIANNIYNASGESTTVILIVWLVSAADRFNNYVLLSLVPFKDIFILVSLSTYDPILRDYVLVHFCEVPPSVYLCILILKLVYDSSK